MRTATEQDLPAIVAIYNSTVAGRMVTADTEEVSIESRQPWFRRHSAERPILVHEIEGQIAAWVSFEPFNDRPGYARTAELSIYIAEQHRGQGLGRALLTEALVMAPDLNIKNLVAFVFSHNEPSLRLFRSFGFTDWAQMPGVAEMDGKEYGLTILGKRIGD